jgi:hypothetical protein
MSFSASRGMRSGHHRLQGWHVALLAFTLPLVFALSTGHVWEDFFITYRSSRNLAHGLGLVFTPGEHVHSFTSPLGTLLPALCCWLTGGESDQAALWLFRLFSCGALALAVRRLWRIAELTMLGAAGRWLLAGLLLLDAKIAAFATNGMESAFMILFATITIEALVGPPGRRWWWLALGFAGLMWTRPDGFVPFGAIVTGCFVFLPLNATDETRRVWLGRLIGGVALGALLYAPWVLWAWHYYGSPIPHTIIAKSGILNWRMVLQFVADYPLDLLRGDAWLCELFCPSYSFIGGWPAAVGVSSHVLTVVAALYFFVPGTPRLGRALSAAVFLGGVYLQCMPLSPWYLPVWQMLAMLTLAFAFDRLWQAVSRPAAHAVLRVGLATTIAVQAALFVCSAWQLRVRQRVVEVGVRQAVGLWLKAHAAATDTVFLEPLGYIGYYSGLKCLDYPGLASPEVVAARTAGYRTFAAVAVHLRPTWLALRPPEGRAILAAYPNILRRDYEIATIFDARPLLAARSIPGRAWLESDACFIILHRRG